MAAGNRTRTLNDDTHEAEVPRARPTRRFAKIPVRCPQCGNATVMKCHWIVVTTALSRWNQMKLRAVCCAVTWDASVTELAGIRQFLEVSSDGR